MTGPEESIPADIAQLREEFPGWRFGTMWVSAGNRPDARRLTAVKDGILLSAWNRAELANSIRYEEAHP